MKKKDIIIIGIVLCIAGVGWFLSQSMMHNDGTSLRITVDGQVYGTYSLLENREIEIMNTNVCKIEDGVVCMIEATCPDHLCMKQRSIDNKGGTIVCLPNKIVLEITGNAEEEVDVIAN